MGYRVQCRMVSTGGWSVQSIHFDAYDQASLWAEEVLQDGIGIVDGYLIEQLVHEHGQDHWRAITSVEHYKVAAREEGDQANA